jgi:hypothetical protein
LNQRELGDVAPQGIGDIIGLAFRITRTNLVSIFRYILVPSLCTLAVTIMFELLGHYGASYVAETKNIAAAIIMALLFLVGVFLSALTWWFLGLRLLSLVRFILGFSPTLEDASKNMMRRAWPLVGLNALASLIIGGISTFAIVFIVIIVALGAALSAVLGPFVTVLTTALGIIVGFSLLIFAAGFYVFMNCVYACEEQPVGAVLGRAWQLSTSHIFRFIWFSLVFYVVYCIINYPLSLPILIATAADVFRYQMSGGVTALGPYKQPLYLLIFTSTWGTGMGFIMRPLFLFGFAFLYYDLRLRQDGIDIRRKLEALKSALLANA